MDNIISHTQKEKPSSVYEQISSALIAIISEIQNYFMTDRTETNPQTLKDIFDVQEFKNRSNSGGGTATPQEIPTATSKDKKK